MNRCPGTPLASAYALHVRALAGDRDGGKAEALYREDGDLPLDASLGLFERGVALSRYCHEQIGSAERRIEQLTERGEVRDASHLADTDGNDR